MSSLPPGLPPSAGKDDYTESKFRQSTKDKLAERAAHICSNPFCTALTSSADASTSGGVIRAGVAAHIRGRQPTSARHDEDQRHEQRRHITNRIWLCTGCSVRIDANNGRDFSVETLHHWKDSHEAVLRSYALCGWKIRLVSEHGDASDAEAFLDFLSNKGALFIDAPHEIPSYVLLSVDEIRRTALSLQPKLEPHSPLRQAAKAISDACRVYMNFTPPDAEFEQFQSSLGALRKAVGLAVRDVSGKYSLNVAPELVEIVDTPW